MGQGEKECNINETETTVSRAELSKIETIFVPAHSKDNLQIDQSNSKRNPPIVKGCFIATAAMGSALHPHVQLLREFRDNILLKSRYKHTFENLLDKYYIFSPPVAKVMNKHAAIKVILRYLLVFPVVFGIKGILPLVNIILGIERDAKRLKEQKMYD